MAAGGDSTTDLKGLYFSQKKGSATQGYTAFNF
jgi:hypothetical protein